MTKKLEESQNIQPKKFTPLLSSFLIGGTAGCVAKTVIAPLDRAKINFQTSEMYYSIDNLWQFLVHSYRSYGICSLWRGHSATLVRIFPYAAVQYSVHERAKNMLGIHEADLSHLSTSSIHMRRLLAGMLAGLFSLSATYPLDLARARMAVTYRATYTNLFDVLRLSYKEEGFLCLYQGFTPALVGVVPYAGIAFFTFETLKSWCLKRGKDPDGRPKEKLKPFENLCCGALAGVTGQTLVYPIDIVRRRMQTAAVTGHPEYTRSILATMKLVYNKEGLMHGLFKGVTLNWIKGPIASGISFTVFHQLQQLYRLWKPS